MKIASLALGLSALCLIAGPAASGPPALPDLVITNFGLSSWETCSPGKTLFNMQVRVQNVGKGTWTSGNPAILVTDLHHPQWETGIAVGPPLAPGQARTITVPVFYLPGTHMTAAAPHPFHATVNPNHAIAESNFANNDGPGTVVWNGKKVIMVGAPKGCPKP